MPKIFIIILFIFSFIKLNCQVIISPVLGNINSINSQLNFVQINDSLAYFTEFYFEDDKLKSSILQAKHINGEWFRNTIDKYKIENSNTGNFTHSHINNTIYFSACNFDYNNCDLYRSESNKLINLKEINNEAFLNNYNSQPHFFYYKNQSFLAFSSDRKGGFGGLDIWICSVDKNGNIGSPINAGPNINSRYNEITPFYNHYESALYFSSNCDTNNIGGYDIYSSNGFPNMWKNKKNIFEFNTKNDEMYCSFYDSTNGYFSSNRNSNCNYADSCCSDVFVFQSIKENITEKIEKDKLDYSAFLPLNLYFDNNTPSELDFTETPNYNYKKSYIDYFMNLDKYTLYNKENINVFFEDSLRGNFNKLNKLLDILSNNLQQGYTINLKIRGYASQLADDKYNVKISSLRIKSLINYINSYSKGALNQYLTNNKLNIVEVPLGESLSLENKKNSSMMNIYGTDAILNRKVSILKIDAYK